MTTLSIFISAFAAKVAEVKWLERHMRQKGQRPEGLAMLRYTYIACHVAT